jgi:hypothetical protein
VCNVEKRIFIVPDSDVVFCKLNFVPNDKIRDNTFAPYHCLEFCSKLGSFGHEKIGYRDTNTWTGKPSLLCVNFAFFVQKFTYIVS